MVLNLDIENSKTLENEFLTYLSTLSSFASSEEGPHILEGMRFMAQSDLKCEKTLKHYLNIAKTSRDYYYHNNGVHQYNAIRGFSQPNTMNGKF